MRSKAPSLIDNNVCLMILQEMDDACPLVTVEVDAL
jgi:hypothetical protein